MRTLLLSPCLVTLLLLPLSVGRADDGGRPAFTAVLCQSWEQGTAMPEAPTDSFHTDNPTIRLVFRAPEAVAAGHRMTPVICIDEEGAVSELFRGAPSVADGSSNTFGQSFNLAGRPWAQRGGKFRFRIIWDDETEPVIDLPFTVKVANRWALLVGISDYAPAGPTPGDLPASDKDAQRMKDLLEGSFGFSPERIVLVQNLEATRERLDRELDALSRRAGPDDAVLFYYCGHGTQVPDLDGDEDDGWDEALATSDLRPPLLTTPDHLKLVLTDDRIAELLAQFKTKNVTVIFDSCHSGTAVRAGDEAEVRVDAPGFYLGMQQDLGIGRQLAETAEDVDRSGAKGIAAGLDIDERYVFLSAARSWETGMTDPEGCFFSRYLREAMRSSNGQSWEAIVNGVRPKVQGDNPGQSPQVTGASRRFPFSLAEAPRDETYQRPSVALVGAWKSDTPGSIWIMGAPGQMALVSGMDSLYQEYAGVVYDVYPASDEQFTGPPKGRVTLTGKLQLIQRENTSPLAYAGATIDEGSVRRGDRLIARSVPLPRARPIVGLTFFTNTAPAALQQLQTVVKAVLALLGKESSVQVMTSGSVSRADYVIVPSLVEGKFVASLFTPRSDQVGSCGGTPQEIASMIRDFVVSRHRTFARINRLQNPSPAFRLRVVMEGGEGRRAPGSKIACRGYAGVPAHLAVFAATDKGELEFVSASEGLLQPEVPFSFSIGTNAAFKGRMVVHVFATSKPLDTAAIAKASSTERADLLMRQLAGISPAEGTPGAVGTGGWATERLWVELK